MNLIMVLLFFALILFCINTGFTQDDKNENEYVPLNCQTKCLNERYLTEEVLNTMSGVMVKIIKPNENNTLEVVATGIVLSHPNNVLTLASSIECLNIYSDEDCSKYTVRELFDLGKQYEIADIVVHPMHGGTWTKYDLAILYLGTPFSQPEKPLFPFKFSNIKDEGFTPGAIIYWDYRNYTLQAACCKLVSFIPEKFTLQSESLVSVELDHEVERFITVGAPVIAHENEYVAIITYTDEYSEYRGVKGEELFAVKPWIMANTPWRMTYSGGIDCRFLVNYSMIFGSLMLLFYTNYVFSV